MPVRIVIADDHEVVRMGLRALLEREPGWTGCGEAATARTLVEAVRTIVNRQTFFPLPVVAVARLAVADDRAAGGACPPASGPLTPRESEVLALLAAGRTNKEIAAALGISIKTAETHRARILRKLDLHSMNELVRYALRNHLIEP